MTTPYVPVPIPIGSSTNFTINRNQRRSSLGSISTCSDSPKGQIEESSQSNFKKMSIPDEIGTTSCACNSPLVRTKMLGLNTSMEYYIQPLETTEQNTLDNWEDRPATPTILGYEVMEERAKFTVYKVLVKKNPEENWVVFRRYTDFSRLNDKLKDMFPGFRLALPPKRWFKDNYNPDFLEDRQLGLQAFLQNLVAHKDIANWLKIDSAFHPSVVNKMKTQIVESNMLTFVNHPKTVEYVLSVIAIKFLAVREFLCLDDPPGPFDSLEESRAFCETLEETNYRLQKELNEKQKVVETLKKLLTEKELYINEMEKRLGDLNLVETKSCKLSGEGSECSGEVESSATEADQRTLDEDSRSEKEDWKTSWSGSLVENFVPEIEVAEVAYTADIEM